MSELISQITPNKSWTDRGPRYSARSGGLATAPTTSFLPSASFSTRSPFTGGGGLRNPIQSNITVFFPEDRFLKAILRYERNILYKTARYAQRTYRSTLNRTPPRKFTRASYKPANILAGKPKRHTLRYKKEVLRPVSQQAARAPYKRTGKLKNQVNFTVNERTSDFVAGPPLDRSLEAYRVTRSQQAIPGLLDQGGPATVRMYKIRLRKDGTVARKGYIYKRVTYRAFPYVQKAKTKSLEFMKKKMAEEKLRN